MGLFCDQQDCLQNMAQADKQALINRIRRKLGAPVMTVELMDEQIVECICESIEEYSTQINTWVLNNRLGEMLGLPSDVDFTLKYVSNSLYFERSFATSVAEQVSLGANGIREHKTDSIALTAGTQDYIIPAGREVSDILWFTPSFINLYGLDPFANSNIEFYEFGASFAGYTLYYVMPVFDTILTAQAAQLRNRVRGSEYSYILRPGANGTKTIKLFPIPMPSSSDSSPSFGIGAGFGTPGYVYYNYLDRPTVYGNFELSGYTANPGFTGLTSQQQSLGFQGNGLVSTPADATLNYLAWNQLNTVAQTWIKKYAQADAKELLGESIRGKFTGDLPIPDAQIKLNSDYLRDSGRADKTQLKEELAVQLGELNYEKILEKRAIMQKSINETLTYIPLGIGPMF